VLVDNLLKETAIDAVVCDNAGGAYHATRHLIDVHNLHKLVFLSGPENWFSSIERRRGYERAMHESGESPRAKGTPRWRRPWSAIPTLRVSWP